MKKLILVIAVLVASVLSTFAQNDTVIYMANHPEYTYICLNRFDRVLVYGPECQDYTWTVRVNGGYEQHPEGNLLTINGVFGDTYSITYNGCDLWWSFQMHFTDDRWVPTSFTHEVWKHQGETMMLQAVQNVNDSIDGDFYWSTGEGGYSVWEIPVSEPGVYVCQIPAMCGTAIRTFIVRDNVEVYRATVDLETNLNKTTWQVTDAQAEYIGEVKVYRDGLLVGTAPYEQGYYLDAIGSDNAARNYKIVGVSNEGEDCPIASYEKGTIHTTYYQDVNGNLNMTWNIPYVEESAQGTLTYFQICKYDPNTGEITVVDQVNSSITDYTCGVNQFDGGYAVIAAVFNDGKGVEELSFSNLTTDILGIEEDGLLTGLGTFTVYPNPAKGRVTIEGTGEAIITNTLGQTILTREIDGKETIALPQGMYFVKMNGVTRKIVVE